MTKQNWIASSLLLFTAAAGTANAKPRPIQVKVVVVAMFESAPTPATNPANCSTGWNATTWTTIYPLACRHTIAVRMNDQGEMAVLTGQGTAHAASTIMAVGLDPRFDFSHAYWIVAGIAGGSPDRSFAGIGCVGAMGSRRRPGLRNRCARDSAGLVHRLSAAAQEDSFRSAGRTA